MNFEILKSYPVINSTIIIKLFDNTIYTIENVSETELQISNSVKMIIKGDINKTIIICPGYIRYICEQTDIIINYSDILKCIIRKS